MGALYLLFNEGYHGASTESAVQAELCREATRLTALLLDHPLAATPATRALSALMCFHAARLAARVDAAGDLRPLFEPPSVGIRQLSETNTGEREKLHAFSLSIVASDLLPRGGGRPWKLV